MPERIGEITEEEIQRLAARAEFYAAGEFFRCPTSGRILAGTGDVGDDKVLCGCWKAREGKVGVGTHLKTQLPKATAREYVMDYERHRPQRGR